MSVVYGECVRNPSTGQWSVVSEFVQNSISLTTRRDNGVSYVPSKNFDQWKKEKLGTIEDFLPVVFIENLMWPSTWYQIIIFPKSHKHRASAHNQMIEDVCGGYLVDKWIDDIVTSEEYENLLSQYE